MPVDDMVSYPITEAMDDVWLNDNEFEPVYEVDYTFGTDDAADILLDSIPAVLSYPEQLSEVATLMSVSYYGFALKKVPVPVHFCIKCLRI